MLTANEQYLVELVNRARADPAAEADRLRIELNADLAPGTIDASAKEPLAIRATLHESAEAHSGDMMRRNYFDHVTPEGSTPLDRIVAAGWEAPDGGWVGENIAALFAATDTVAGPDAVDDHHNGLFRSAGHRENILSETFSEIGIGQAYGSFAYEGFDYDFTSLVTQHFADAGRTYITGVAIADADGDGFYDVGEGLAGVSVSASRDGSTLATTTYESGGYSIEVPGNGRYEVAFEGGGLGESIVQTVRVRGENVKVDAIVDPDIAAEPAPRPEPAETPADAAGPLAGADFGDTPARPDRPQPASDGVGFIRGTQSSDLLVGSSLSDVLAGRRGDDDLFGLAGDDKLHGSSGDDTLTGGLGEDVLLSHVGDDFADGGAGDDILITAQGEDSLLGGAGDDKARAGFGADTLFGEAGRDKLYGEGGADLLFGGEGDDLLRGGKGSDTLLGGLGDDLLDGEEGFDLYLYKGGRDRFVFEDGRDRIDLRPLDLTGYDADIADNIIDTGRGALISFAPGSTVLLLGTEAEDVTASDFIF